MAGHRGLGGGRRSTDRALLATCDRQDQPHAASACGAGADLELAAARPDDLSDDLEAQVRSLRPRRIVARPVVFDVDNRGIVQRGHPDGQFSCRAGRLEPVPDQVAQRSPEGDPVNPDVDRRRVNADPGGNLQSCGLQHALDKQVEPDHSHCFPLRSAVHGNLIAVATHEILEPARFGHDLPGTATAFDTDIGRFIHQRGQQHDGAQLVEYVVIEPPTVVAPSAPVCRADGMAHRSTCAREFVSQTVPLRRGPVAA